MAVKHLVLRSDQVALGPSRRGGPQAANELFLRSSPSSFFLPRFLCSISPRSKERHGAAACSVDVGHGGDWGEIYSNHLYTDSRHADTRGVQAV